MFKLTAVNLVPDPPSDASYWHHPVLIRPRDDTCSMLPASNMSSRVIHPVSIVSDVTWDKVLQLSQHPHGYWLVNTYLRSHHHPHMVHVIIMWQLVTTDHVSCSGRGHLRPIWTFHHSFSIKSASQRCLHARLIPQNSSHVTWKVIFSWNSHILSLMIIPVGRKCWAWWWYDTNSSSTRVWSIISLRPLHPRIHPAHKTHNTFHLTSHLAVIKGRM